jgi:hypothetical protein
MKSVILAIITMVSLNVKALDLSLTEGDVKDKFKAENAYFISRATLISLLKDKDNDACEIASRSRSGRAFVFEKGDNLYLAATASGKDQLKQCGQLELK